MLIYGRIILPLYVIGWRIRSFLPPNAGETKVVLKQIYMLTSFSSG